MHDNQNNAVPRMPKPQWHSWFGNLVDYLPAGTGRCLDLGCGDQSAAQPVESRGYRWVGLDVETRFRRPRPGFVCGDGQALLLGRRVARIVAPMMRLGFELRCAAWRLWRSLRKSPNAEGYRDYGARKCLELAGHVVWRACKENRIWGAPFVS